MYAALGALAGAKPEEKVPFSQVTKPFVITLSCFAFAFVQPLASVSFVNRPHDDETFDYKLKVNLSGVDVVLLRPLLAALIMGWAVHLLRALPVILTVLSGMLIYGMLLLLLGVLGKEEVRFVRGLRPGGVEP